MIRVMRLGPVQTNTYFLIHENDCVIIDPADEGQRILDYLDHEQLELQAILLTHGHYDHIGAVDDLLKVYHVPVFAHRDTIQVLQDPSMSLNEATNFTIVPLVSDYLRIPHFTFRIYHTPGHVIGSVMFYSEEDEALFSGDTLFQGSIGRYDFPGSNVNEMIQSLDLINHLDFDADVYPGHGNPTRLSYEQASNPYLLQVKKMKG